MRPCSVMSAVVLTCWCETESEWTLYIQVSSVCSERLTVELLLLGPRESCLRFSLKHFRPKSLFGLASSSSSLWTVEEEERSAAPVPPLPALCCVAHDEPRSQLLYFCPWVEWHLIFVVVVVAVFKTGDVFVSLMSAPGQGDQQPCWYCMWTWSTG